MRKHQLGRAENAHSWPKTRTRVAENAHSWPKMRTCMKFHLPALSHRGQSDPGHGSRSSIVASFFVVVCLWLRCDLKGLWWPDI